MEDWQQVGLPAQRVERDLRTLVKAMVACEQDILNPGQSGRDPIQSQIYRGRWRAPGQPEEQLQSIQTEGHSCLGMARLPLGGVADP